MHLLPLLAVSLALGLAAGRPGAAFPVLAASLAARRARPARAPALAFLLGALLAAAPSPSPLARAFPRGRDLVRIRGTVLEGPDPPRRGSSRLVLAVREVEGVKIPGRVAVLAPAGSPLPSPGARVTVTGRLVPPRGPENPGQLDPRLRLARRGISHLLLLPARTSLRVDARASPLSLRALAHRCRLALEKRLRRSPRRATAAVLQSLLLGRKADLPPRVVDAFRRSGTAHFLAVSGLHVGLVAAGLWLLLRPLLFPRRAAALLVAAAALAYAAVTGLRPPAFRAALLVLGAAAATALGRRPRPFPLLALAALVILALDPAAVFDAGFHLSFTAVIAILLLARRIEDGLFARRKLLARFTVPRERPLPLRLLERYAIRMVPVSLAAWLGTAPLVLHYFGTLSLLVLPANLLVFPLVALLLPLGLIAGLTGFLLPAVPLARALVTLVAGLASLPCASVTVPPPPPPALAAFYGLLLLLARRPRIGLRTLALLVPALAGLALSGPLLRRPPASPRLTLVSVGPGLCALVETPEGGILLYDLGSRRPLVFSRAVLPVLRHRGIRRIDALVLSRSGPEHASGVPALLAHLPVRRVYRPGDLRSRDVVPLPGARIDVLWPPPGMPVAGPDASTVLRVRMEGLTILLPGDLRSAGIRALREAGGDLRADVLVLPRRGRPDPASSALREAVRARLLLASDGRGDRLDPAWAGALRTSQRGAVTVTPGPRAECFLPP